jgi:hypothetical protein
MSADPMTVADQHDALLAGSEERAGIPDGPTRAVLDEAEALVAAGRGGEAVDLLVRRNDEVPHPALERALVTTRFAAGQQAVRAVPPRGSWPPVHPDLFGDVDGVVEIEPHRLDAGTLGSAVTHHGCLIVRGLIDPATAERLRGNIDRSFEARRALEAGEMTADQAAPWYVPTDIGGKMHQFGRANYVRAIDSPRGLADLIGVFTRTGLLEAATGYLGERPAFSAHKANLRRTVAEGPNAPPPGGDYHQDGAFLVHGAELPSGAPRPTIGHPIRTINAWTPLTACGEDAASIDLVPRRLPDVLPTGIDGALFDWTISPATAEGLAGDRGIIRPHFEPGDVLLFDELLLHRTGYSTGMTQDRYATETWFFAPSTYPERQVPILV